jgi:hypothetical protein
MDVSRGSEEACGHNQWREANGGAGELLSESDMFHLSSPVVSFGRLESISQPPSLHKAQAPKKGIIFLVTNFFTLKGLTTTISIDNETAQSSNSHDSPRRLCGLKDYCW